MNKERRRPGGGGRKEEENCPWTSFLRGTVLGQVSVGGSRSEVGSSWQDDIQSIERISRCL